MKKKRQDLTEKSPADAAEVCAYAAQMIAARMERMRAEAKQAKRGKRTEPIHQMRVWSRRSRAALEMFAPCFSGRRYAGVAQAVHDVTGALGAARDLDVMILTLRERANTLPDEQRAGLFAFVKVMESAAEGGAKACRSRRERTGAKRRRSVRKNAGGTFDVPIRQQEKKR